MMVMTCNVKSFCGSNFIARAEWPTVFCHLV